MNYDTIQKIALGVVESSAACDGQMFTGTVTNAKPLSIKLGEEAGAIEIDGDDIILTQSVVSKKIYIKKHDHKESKELIDVMGVTSAGPVTFLPAGANIPLTPDGNPDMDNLPAIGGETLTLNHSHTIYTSTLDAWVTEYGYKLPVEPEQYNQDGEQVVITINRGLDKGDKVIMSRVSGGQQFIVLSRYFEVDNQGKDDDE